MAQRMAGTMAIVAEAALRFFHRLTDSVEIVTRRNHGEEQD